jgi:GT2 family glycosyltransferase
MNQPLVTVNILSFNRRDDLRITLQKVFEQDYKNIEVVVVDNNSSDGSVEMVKSDYPAVQIIELKQNIGIAGWNEGFKEARGEYVLVLDDDSYPRNGSILSCLEPMKKHRTCGIVSALVYNCRNNCIEKNWRIHDELRSFKGSGSLIRTDIFSSVGMFSEKLFLYYHEMEFAMRVIDHNYKIYEAEDAIIDHNESLKNRSLSSFFKSDLRKAYYETRNIIYILVKYFPLSEIFWKLSRIIAGRVFWGLRHFHLTVIVKAIYSGFLLLDKREWLYGNLKTRTREKYLFGNFGGGFFFDRGSFNNRRPSWLIYHSRK